MILARLRYEGELKTCKVDYFPGLWLKCIGQTSLDCTELIRIRYKSMHPVTSPNYSSGLIRTGSKQEQLLLFSHEIPIQIRDVNSLNFPFMSRSSFSCRFKP